MEEQQHGNACYSAFAFSTAFSWSIESVHARYFELCFRLAFHRQPRPRQLYLRRCFFLWEVSGLIHSEIGSGPQTFLHTSTHTHSANGIHRHG